jgi:hypothetical protein
MISRPSVGLIDVLRSTISRLERAPDIGPDDPAVITLKRILLRRIAEIQEAPSQEEPVQGEPTSQTEAPVIETESALTEAGSRMPLTLISLKAR